MALVMLSDFQFASDARGFDSRTVHHLRAGLADVDATVTWFATASGSTPDRGSIFFKQFDLSTSISSTRHRFGQRPCTRTGMKSCNRMRTKKLKKLPPLIPITWELSLDFEERILGLPIWEAKTPIGSYYVRTYRRDQGYLWTWSSTKPATLFGGKHCWNLDDVKDAVRQDFAKKVRACFK